MFSAVILITFITCKHFRPYIQLKSSNIGNFSVANLQGFLSLMREPLIFFLNLKLKHGIPLPSIDHVSFSGFSFHLEDVSSYWLNHTLKNTLSTLLSAIPFAVWVWENFQHFFYTKHACIQFICTVCCFFNLQCRILLLAVKEIWHQCPVFKYYH